MEKAFKKITEFVTSGNASKVKELVYGSLNNKVKAALNTKKEALAKDSFAGGKNGEGNDK